MVEVIECIYFIEVNYVRNRFCMRIDDFVVDFIIYINDFILV